MHLDLHAKNNQNVCTREGMPTGEKLAKETRDKSRNHMTQRFHE